MTSEKQTDPSTHATGEYSVVEAHDPGIRLTLVWLVSSRFEDRGLENLREGEPDFDPGDEVDIEPLAEVWISDDKAALVQLTVRVSPKKEATFVAEVSYAAQYVVVSEPVMPIAEFAWGNGLANLVPFVRARLAMMTNDSRFPAYYLQPINLAELQVQRDETRAYQPTVEPRTSQE